jgi:hypothetical protein
MPWDRAMESQVDCHARHETSKINDNGDRVAATGQFRQNSQLSERLDQISLNRRKNGTIVRDAALIRSRRRQFRSSEKLPSVNRGAVVEAIQRLFDQGTVVALGEKQLLDRFIARGDESAFEAIVGRHGPMVLSVCRRVLDDQHDVEDAFQATFLILVKKAGSIREREVLGNWL